MLAPLSERPVGEVVRLSVRLRRGTRTGNAPWHISLFFTFGLIFNMSFRGFSGNFSSSSFVIISLFVNLVIVDGVNRLRVRGFAVVFFVRSYTLPRITRDYRGRMKSDSLLDIISALTIASRTHTLPILLSMFLVPVFLLMMHVRSSPVSSS